MNRIDCAKLTVSVKKANFGTFSFAAIELFEECQGLEDKVI